MAATDLNLLPVFVTVAETASFSAAARKLGLPKSSVSRAVARLEQEMGVQLLHRTTRKVALSTAGTALYERVVPALKALTQSLGELPELDDAPSGRLRVTAPIDLGATVIAELVARFTARYPAIEVEMHLTNAFVDLVADGYDAALRISQRPLRDSSLRARRLAPIHLQMFAAPTYLARRGTPRAPAELLEHEWVQLTAANYAARLEGPDGPVAVAPRGRVSCNDMFFVRETLRQGAGVGILPTFLAGPDVAAGTLVRVLARWGVPSGSLYFVCPGSKHLPRKVAAFRDFLVEALQVKPLG